MWDKDDCELDTWCCNEHDSTEKIEVFKALKKPDSRLPFDTKPKQMRYLIGSVEKEESKTSVVK
jgi:hypothetical protein